MSVETVFEILGIENKELQVSNLLAYYFDPKRNLQYATIFLKEFCEACGLDKITDDIVIEAVNREKPIKDNFDGRDYQNYIDIFIQFKEGSQKKRILCIENKIYSEEGYKQTERYVKAIKSQYVGYDDYDFIYLTKNNSYVDLSSSAFKHMRYSDLATILSKSPFFRMPFAKDFCEYYVEREEKEFYNIEKSNRLFGDKKSLAHDDKEKEFNHLISYLVWKINNTRNNKKYEKIFCKNGKSDKSADCFYQISHQEWEDVLNKKFIRIKPLQNERDARSYTMHIEGKQNAVFLHFELHPYLPFSKIEAKYGKAFLEDYLKAKSKIEKLVSNININGIETQNIPGNASLTVGKWKINAVSYKGYLESLMQLIDEVLIKMKTI